MRMCAEAVRPACMVSRNESVRFFSVSRPSAHTGRAATKQSTVVGSGATYVRHPVAAAAMMAIEIAVMILFIW